MAIQSINTLRDFEKIPTKEDYSERTQKEAAHLFALACAFQKLLFCHPILSSASRDCFRMRFDILVRCNLSCLFFKVHMYSFDQK